MILDHLAIQVQVKDLENTVNWYIDFFNCKKNWIQSSDFSNLTKERLPGIKSIVEIESELIKFHLFTTDYINNKKINNLIQYHHLGFSVKNSKEVDEIKIKWEKLFFSGLYKFSKNAHITDKMIDVVGVESLYFTDVNGLEFEVTYIPLTVSGYRKNEKHNYFI